MMKRRELFSSLASFTKRAQEGISTIRPPYFEDENSFMGNCANCGGKCALSCEENIIVIQDDKTPILDFLKGGCTYCDKCAEVCEFEVLHVENKKNINAKITIDVLKCISWHKTMCFSCKELCMEDAIVFLGLFRPEIDMEKCTSCGFCVNVCPTEAIKVEKWQ